MVSTLFSILPPMTAKIGSWQLFVCLPYRNTVRSLNLVKISTENRKLCSDFNALNDFRFPNLWWSTYGVALQLPGAETLHHSLPPTIRKWTRGPICPPPSYYQISRSLEATKSSVKMIVSIWNLTCASPPVKFQNDRTKLNPYLAGSRFREIWKTSCLV